MREFQFILKIEGSFIVAPNLFPPRGEYGRNYEVVSNDSDGIKIIKSPVIVGGTYSRRGSKYKLTQVVNISGRPHAVFQLELGG